MITFGFKTPWSGAVRAAASLGLGVLAVAYPGDVIPLLVKIFAAVLFVYGCGMLVYAFLHKAEKSFSLWLSNSIIEIVVAVLVFVFATFISNIAVKLIGLVLLLSGIYQIIALLSAERVSRFGFWFFILPFVEAIGGGLLMFASQLFTNVVGLIVGIALIVSGLSELFSSIKIFRIQKKFADDNKTEEQDAQVKTVEDGGKGEEKSRKE